MDARLQLLVLKVQKEQIVEMLILCLLKFSNFSFGIGVEHRILWKEPIGDTLKLVFGHFGKLHFLCDIRWSELVYVHSVSFSHIFILFIKE